MLTSGNCIRYVLAFLYYVVVVCTGIEAHSLRQYILYVYVDVYVFIRYYKINQLINTLHDTAGTYK